MSLPRRWATRLLHFTRDHSSDNSREWAEAMLRELDFIESDWAALFWALGSATAIFRQGGFVNGLRDKEGRVNQSGKNAIGVVSGIGIGLAVAAAVIALRMMWYQYFPDPQAGVVPWRLLLLVFALPEVIFAATAIALWQKRRPMAVGVLLMAVGAAVHLAIHFASRWRG